LFYSTSISVQSWGIGELFDLIQKKHAKKIRINPKTSSMTFSEVDDGLTAEYDASLLQKYLPPTQGVVSADPDLVAGLGGVIPEHTVKALNATEFVNVYGRVVRDQSQPDIMCLQYIYVWDYQAVPAHEADYEPIYVFVDKDHHYLVYDLVHYCSRRLDLGASGSAGPGLRVVPGWHSFLPDGELPLDVRDRDLDVQPLSDQHLRSWWSISDYESQLKIDEFLMSPFLLEAPGHFLADPDEDSKTMCCTFLQIEQALAETDNVRDGVLEGIRRSLTNCVTLFTLYRLGSLIKLLLEMSEVGLVTVPISLKDGLNLGAIGAMLNNGVVTLTEAGRGLMERMKGSQED
jgi:hypothetical protein